MAGEDAHDLLILADDTFRPQFARPGDAGRRRRLAAEAAGADLRLGVEHLLVARLADDAVHLLQRPQRLGQIYRQIDFDRAGDRRGPQVPRRQAAEVRLAPGVIRTAAVPA